MADPIIVPMKFIKTTKNCYRYKAADGAEVDCVYLQKSALIQAHLTQPPKSIVVEVHLPADREG